MPKQYYLGQEFRGYVEFFGKPYAWFKDHDGTLYLVKIDEEGKPVFA